MAAYCACAVRAYLCAYLSLHFMTSYTCFAFWSGGYEDKGTQRAHKGHCSKVALAGFFVLGMRNWDCTQYKRARCSSAREIKRNMNSYRTCIPEQKRISRFRNLIDSSKGFYSPICAHFLTAVRTGSLAETKMTSKSPVCTCLLARTCRRSRKTISHAIFFVRACVGMGLMAASAKKRERNEERKKL